MVRALKALLSLSVLIVPFILLGGTANADPYWQAVTKTNKFHCSAQVPHPSYNVTVQTCVVVNSTATQAVVIVANHGTAAVSLEAPHVELYVNGTITYDRNCLASTLSGGYTRACFAPTQVRPCSAVMHAWGNFIVQGYAVWVRSPGRQMCT